MKRTWTVLTVFLLLCCIPASFGQTKKKGEPTTRSVQGAVPRFAKKTAPTNESAASTPAATACSCDAAHLAKPVGSGVDADLTVAVAKGVADATARVEVVVGVASTLAGAVQDTSIIAKIRRRITGR